MILKHRDRELLRFDWVEPQGVRIVSVNETERQFLPLEMAPLGARASSPRSETVVTDESLWTWLRRRTVPKNRHYVDAMLGHLGIRQKVSAKEGGSVKRTSRTPLAVQIKANLEADPFITYVELSELLGIPPRTLARRMKELQDAGEIHRVGADKNGYWEVVSQKGGPQP